MISVVNSLRYVYPGIVVRLFRLAGFGIRVMVRGVRVKEALSVLQRFSALVQ